MHCIIMSSRHRVIIIFNIATNKLMDYIKWTILNTNRVRSYGPAQSPAVCICIFIIYLVTAVLFYKYRYREEAGAGIVNIP